MAFTQMKTNLGFSKLGGSVPVDPRTPEYRAKDPKDILNWMRRGKPDDADVNSEFKKIDQMLPKRKGQTARERPAQLHPERGTKKRRYRLFQAMWINGRSANFENMTNRVLIRNCSHVGHSSSSPMAGAYRS
jgi:hypothetical protein